MTFAERGEELKRDIEFFVDSFSGALTRFCISLCGNTHDAEDLFQETWYKAVKCFEKYDERLPFDKWLFSICINTFKNQKKLFYNKNKVEFRTDEEKQTFLNSIPNAKEENSDTYIELHEAVQSLPLKLKIVVVLYYFNGYSSKEISRLLKIPEGTVKSRLFSARENLKRRLNREQEI